MKYCPKCNYQADDNSKFCMRCGTPLVTKEITNTSEPQNNGWRSEIPDSRPSKKGSFFGFGNKKQKQENAQTYEQPQNGYGYNYGGGNTYENNYAAGSTQQAETQNPQTGYNNTGYSNNNAGYGNTGYGSSNAGYNNNGYGGNTGYNNGYGNNAGYGSSNTGYGNDAGYGSSNTGYGNDAGYGSNTGYGNINGSGSNNNSYGYGANPQPAKESAVYQTTSSRPRTAACPVCSDIKTLSESMPGDASGNIKICRNCAMKISQFSGSKDFYFNDVIRNAGRMEPEVIQSLMNVWEREGGNRIDFYYALQDVSPEKASLFENSVRFELEEEARKVEDEIAGKVEQEFPEFKEADSASAERETSPMSYGMYQEQPVSAPAEPEIVPVEPAPAPAEPEIVPVEPAPAPAEPEIVPIESAPAPAEPEIVPAEPEPAPAPAEPEIVPAEPEPVPMSFDIPVFPEETTEPENEPLSFELPEELKDTPKAAVVEDEPAAVPEAAESENVPEEESWSEPEVIPEAEAEPGLFTEEEPENISEPEKCEPAAVPAAENSVFIGMFSVADELKKFKDLLDAGVVTEEEFAEQKKKLLALDYQGCLPLHIYTNK